jgi:hypothetical protein
MNRHERRKAKKKPDQIECEIVFDGVDMFFVIDGKRMAKRENRSWTPLVPGFEIHDNLYGGDIDALDRPEGNA